ncbi:MAG: Hsp20/alpha crystallin family protein [Thermodesulfobacteriota bacterium]
MINRGLFDFPGFGWRGHFEELNRMRRHLDQVFGQLGEGQPVQQTSGVFPLINLTESKDAYIIRAELPGVSAENLDIQTTGRNISITGQRQLDPDKSAKYHRRERETGQFARAVALPGDIDREGVSATLKDGILQVTAPKSEAAKPKQIKIS